MTVVLALAVLGAFNAHAAGPTSELYITVNGQALAGIQGTSVLFNVAESSSNQSPLAVNSTVRTLGIRNGTTGGEYSLTGTATGTTYAFPAGLGSDSFYDGTTDGSFNYAWDFSTGAAYRFNLDWTGGTVLFTPGNGNPMGITYDPSNASLWISGFQNASSTLISDYSLTGTLLSSFDVGHAFNSALALDPADGTLWLVSGANSSLTLEQYSRSAAGSFGATETALNKQTYAGISNNGFGGEFRYTGSVVPEPATWITMVGGLAILGCVQRRRRRA